MSSKSFSVNYRFMDENVLVSRRDSSLILFDWLLEEKERSRGGPGPLAYDILPVGFSGA